MYFLAGPCEDREIVFPKMRFVASPKSVLRVAPPNDECKPGEIQSSGSEKMRGMIAAKMMPIVLFVFVFSLLLERLLKFYGPQSPIMLAVTSFAILSVALYIILSPTYSSHDKNWAYVSVGIVLGLWLKNSRQQPTT
jgi:hypothetical protein